MDKVIASILIALICFPNLGISYIYFASSKNSLFGRILVSIHGILFFLNVPYGYILGKSTSFNNYQEWMILSLFSITGIALCSIIYSIFGFRGNKLTHLWQLINLPTGLFLSLYGLLSITHDSI